MSYPQTTIAPHTYQDAHEGTTQIRRERIRLRDEAEKHMILRSDFEDAYRKAKHRSIGRVGGKNAEEREANANLETLESEVVRKVQAKLARAEWLVGWEPSTVGDLRWLRDRCDDAARSFANKAYDAIEDQRDYRKLIDARDRDAEMDGAPAHLSEVHR